MVTFLVTYPLSEKRYTSHLKAMLANCNYEFYHGMSLPPFSVPYYCSLILMRMIMSILTSASVSCSFYSYTPHFPSPIVYRETFSIRSSAEVGQGDAAAASLRQLPGPILPLDTANRQRHCVGMPPGTYSCPRTSPSPSPALAPSLAPSLIH